MPGQWPFPGDSPVVKARKMALAYRAALQEMDPALVKEMDQRFADWGQRWHATEHVAYGPEDWVPTDIAASMVDLSTGTLSILRTRGRIKGRLRQKGERGFEYKVKDVLALSTEIRRRNWRNGNSTDKVPANGSSVSNG